MDRRDRGFIALMGNDRASYLNGLLTNDIASLRRGDGCYAVYLTPQGRMLADMVVAELGDMILLDVRGDVKELLLDRFEQFIFTEDVEVRDLSEHWASYGIHGPDAAVTVARALTGSNGDAPQGVAAPMSRLQEHQNIRLKFGELPVVAIVSLETGEPGLRLYLDRRHGEDLRRALCEAGAVPVDPATLETLRVEAGRPEFHVDMDETTIPLEAGLEERAISFTKGCYVGQEVIVRVLHRGHGRVAKRLVGLVIGQESDHDSGAIPVSGDAIRQGVRDVGHVTSAVFSPMLGRPIALGYVHRDLTAPGTEVTIAHRGRQLAAAVVDLPFARGSGGKP